LDTVSNFQHRCRRHIDNNSGAVVYYEIKYDKFNEFRSITQTSILQIYKLCNILLYIEKDKDKSESWLENVTMWYN